MSLINDALKKAQKERTPDKGATPPPPPPRTPAVPPGISRGGKPRKNNTVVYVVCGAVVLVALSVAATVYLLRDQPAAPVVASAPAPTPAKAPTATPPPIGPAPASQVAASPQAAIPAPAETVAPTKAPASNPVAAVNPHPDPEPIVFAPRPPDGGATPAAEAPATEPATNSRGIEIPKPNPRVRTIIERFRITGIRLSAKKVIINERLFAEGDVVEPAIDLRLTKIEKDLLTFVDSTGLVYYKRF